MTELDVMPISLVAHTVFCPRRAWLEVQGEEADSLAITAGTLAHARVDDTTESRPGTERAMLIHSNQYGLSGRCDVVDAVGEHGLSIIEYKSTPVRRRPEITESQRIQVLAQALCLKEMGYDIADASVYFVNHHKQVSIAVNPSSLQECSEWIHRARAVARGLTAPEPLLDDARCTGCSHAAVCLPDENCHPDGEGVRSISAADPHGSILHILTPGARACLREGRVVVQKNGEVLASHPLEQVCGLVVHGNIDLTSALIRELLWRGHTIVWCSGRGRVVGWATSARSPNGQIRVHQHVMSELGCLPVAQKMIQAKISNQATLLRRNGEHTDAVAVLRGLGRQVNSTGCLPELFALEGRAAQTYFGAFPTMLKG